mmetsp:Transcript_6465/g.14962  ORF Transcript_6465/g.14962 Transcript_6465/m.14962 type:complete len:370 (+) Transcript_6465:130-1239(+)
MAFQKAAAYLIVAAATVILISSSVKIGRAGLAAVVESVDFDVLLDLEEWEDGDHSELIMPMNRRKAAAARGDGGPEGVADVLPALLGMNNSSRSKEGMLGSGSGGVCGVVLYQHHVPGEGGDSLDLWVKELAKSDFAGYSSSSKFDTRENFVNHVTELIEGLDPNLEQGGWEFVSSRDNGLAFAGSESTIAGWRVAANQRKCRFVTAVIFSEVMDHSIRHVKSEFEAPFKECASDEECSVEDFESDLVDKFKSEEAPWQGQLDYFLYNTDKAGDLPMKKKVKLGMEVLKDFDLVLEYGRHDFAEEISRVTGLWSDRGVKPARVSDTEGMVYSKDLVSKCGKLSAKNGDADFLDAVGHVYHGDLDFLYAQ